jgi:hypothetical protein
VGCLSLRRPVISGSRWPVSFRKAGTASLLLLKGAVLCENRSFCQHRAFGGEDSKTRACGSQEPPGGLPPAHGFGVAIPSCTGSSRVERLRAAMINTSGPTGKGVVNAMSDLDVTSFTTRPRLAWIFKMRATSPRSLTTEYTRDRRSFDRGVERGCRRIRGSRGRPFRVRSFGRPSSRLRGSRWLFPKCGKAVGPRPQGGVRCCLGNPDMCARSDAIDAGRIWPPWSDWNRGSYWRFPR